MDARELLLQAALKLYAVSGIRGATTKRIAHEAGVNEVTLFRHFGSKEALMQEALAWKAEQSLDCRLPESPADPERELTEFCAKYYGALWDSRELIRVCLGEFADHPEATHVACRTPTRIANQLEAYLKKLKAAGLAPGDWHPQAATSMLMGTLFSDVMGRDCMPERYRLDGKDAVRQYVSLFLRAIGAEKPTPVQVHVPRPRI
jgi:AcrR family transcriptional regulator